MEFNKITLDEPESIVPGVTVYSSGGSRNEQTRDPQDFDSYFEDYAYGGFVELGRT